MEMYKVHQDATLLPVEVKTDDYVFGTEKLPSVSVSASKNAAGITHISVVNINSKKSEEIEIAVTGQQYKTLSGRILTSARIDDHNTFEKPDFVKPSVFKGASLKDGKLKIKLPPFSLVVLELKY